MRVTTRTKDVLAYRRQRRDLLAKGYEEVGEGGGKLWELERGGRMGHKIVDAIVAKNGLSVFVLVVNKSCIGQGERSERERQLPDYALRELDLARGGYDSYGNKIGFNSVQRIFSKWGLSEQWPYQSASAS